MAAPTQAEVEVQITNVIRIWFRLSDYVATDATPADTFIGDEDVLTTSLEGEYSPEVLGAIASFRSTLTSAMGAVGSGISPLLLEMGRAINAPEKNVQSIITRLFLHMIDNAQSVSSRGFTFGAVAADGSNVGDGTIHRLTKDDRDLDIENCTPEAKEAVCVADQYSGATKQEELFQFSGSDAEKDNLRVTGSSLVGTIRAVSAADSLTGNSSWTNFSGTLAVPTAITDWTVGSTLANFEIDQTDFYRDDPSDGGSPASLKFKANDSVEQKFSVRNVTVNASVPYWCSIAFNRAVGSADGTITLTFGDQTEAVVLAAQTGWNILSIPLGPKNWLRTFNATDPTIKVELSGNTTGTLLVDDLMFTPLQPFDGTWYLPIGGPTPFLFVPGTGDKFTWTDSVSGGADGDPAHLQYWFWRAFGRYLPHDGEGVGPTWIDPTI